MARRIVYGDVTSSCNDDESPTHDRKPANSTHQNCAEPKKKVTVKRFLETTLLSILTSALLVSPVSAQDAAEKRYAPPSEHPQNVYFGDTHIHSTLSADASRKGASHHFPLLDAILRDLNKLDRALVGTKE